MALDTEICTWHLHDCRRGAECLYGSTKSLSFAPSTNRISRRLDDCVTGYWYCDDAGTESLTECDEIETAFDDDVQDGPKKRNPVCDNFRKCTVYTDYNHLSTVTTRNI